MANSIGSWRESIFTSRSCNGNKYGDNDASNDDPRRRVLLFKVQVMISLLLEDSEKDVERVGLNKTMCCQD